MSLFGYTKSMASALLELASEYRKQGMDAIFVDAQTSAFRIKMCEACPEFLTESRRCKICTCFMDTKTKLKFDPVESLKKGSNVLTTCPLKLW